MNDEREEPEGVDIKCKSSESTTDGISECSSVTGSVGGLGGMTSNDDISSKSTKSVEFEEGTQDHHKLHDKAIRRKERQLKITMQRYKISAQDIMGWISRNPTKHRELSSRTNYMEIETMKLVIKTIATERETGEEEDNSFRRMMTLNRSNISQAITNKGETNNNGIKKGQNSPESDRNNANPQNKWGETTTNRDIHPTNESKSATQNVNNETSVYGRREG